MTRGLKFCTECGTTLAPGMRFCGHCGHSVPCAVTPAGDRMGKDNGAIGDLVGVNILPVNFLDLKRA